MQAFEVEFVSARLSPLKITDAVRAAILPAPHVSVGDPAVPGQGTRIPLTARLAATLARKTPLIGRAKPFRDPKTGSVVLGVEPSEGGEDSRALVLLSASSGFPDGVSVAPRSGVTLLAQGEAGSVRQLLLIWPDGGEVAVSDLMRDERYALHRAGDQFERVKC